MAVAVRGKEALNAMLQQNFPVDLSVDRCSDEERFQLMHVMLQEVTDHIMWCRGKEFDQKLQQLKLTLKSWQFRG